MPEVFREQPITYVDPQGRTVTTVIEYRAGNRAIVFLTLMIVLGILVGILIPLAGIIMCIVGPVVFFSKDMRDVYHLHPIDGHIVGIYKRTCCCC